MELGGNIELLGFSERDNNDLIVIKKIVGNFTKQISNRLSDFSGLTIELSEADGGVSVTGTVEHGGERATASASGDNLYFALDQVLKSLREQTS